MKEHKILEVPEGASQDDIKKAWRKLSMRYHPDKNGALPAETRKIYATLFLEVQAAYEALTQNTKKNSSAHQASKMQGPTPDQFRFLLRSLCDPVQSPFGDRIMQREKGCEKAASLLRGDKSLWCQGCDHALTNLLNYNNQMGVRKLLDEVLDIIPDAISPTTFFLFVQNIKNNATMIWPDRRAGLCEAADKMIAKNKDLLRPDVMELLKELQERFGQEAAVQKLCRHVPQSRKTSQLNFFPFVA